MRTRIMPPVGVFLPLDNIRAVCAVARDAGVPVHMDGARVFNAAVALRIDVKEITQHPDSVMFCLSKGLCAPVGSLLAGSKEFILRARWCRKIVGGGMKQSGIIAAAGIVALEKMVPRTTVQTNMVRFETIGVLDAESISARMRDEGVLFNARGRGIRLVTHHDVNDQDVQTTLNAFATVLSGT